ncbi:hypothetical protein SAMN05421830_11418 [Desulfomicrobium norvegicum]|uniref:Uncharacterized protein n=1 Tax=Desulfomicrobium norvegicum (strain DSM 1741 / NCIMB 8310) TaxID=52561 RepID=A0A8G2C5B5_DESNO|nr:hypothetical protein SAMN05421830_11418 [Desulfomicrobium norvegicum]
MGGRAVAIRSAPVKTRRNSFAGLVMLNRCVAAREAVAGRLATIQQTMPGSIRQSARLDRDEQDRLVLCVGMVVGGIWQGVMVVGFGKACWYA